MDDLKFEDALEKLEKIVTSLESGKVSLDKSLKTYEEGVKLANTCHRMIEKAQKKVEILVKGDDGKVRLEPFEENQQQTITKKQPKTKTEDQDLFEL